jgi:very-short-patch-repair endonuclease
VIRNRKVEGVKFRRQDPFGRFILDFYSVEMMLAIEVDGGTHLREEQGAYDAWRDEMVRSQRLTVLRFSNDQVLHDLATVLECIAIESRRLRQERTPLPRGEGQG